MDAASRHPWSPTTEVRPRRLRGSEVAQDQPDHLPSSARVRHVGAPERARPGRAPCPHAIFAIRALSSPSHQRRGATRRLRGETRRLQRLLHRLRPPHRSAAGLAQAPSTRASGRSAPTAASATSGRSCRPTTPATAPASTPSPWAPPSPVRWSSLRGPAGGGPRFGDAARSSSSSMPPPTGVASATSRLAQPPLRRPPRPAGAGHEVKALSCRLTTRAA